MKRKLDLIILLFVLFIAGCSNSEYITKSPEEQVESHLSQYLAALESKDIDSLVNLTEDIRFPDKRVQMQQYKRIITDIKDTSIKEIRKISETEYMGIVTMNIDGDDKELQLPIIRDLDDEWIIIVGQDY